MKKTILILIALIFLTASPFIQAGLHHWSGGGANEFWSNPGNWIEGPPTAGEAAPVELVFPIASAKHLTNDIPALSVDTLRMFGTAVTLHGQGGIALLLRGGAPTTIYSRGVNALASSLPLILEGTSVVNSDGGTNNLTIASVLSGAGGLTKTGLGVLTYASPNDNTYTGTTTVLRGSLRLGNANLLETRVALAGPLVIGESNPTNSPNVLLLRSHQIANGSSLRINENGTLRLGGFDDAIGALTMTGGTIYTDDGANVGTLTLGGEVTYHHTPVIVGGVAGHISLGNATRTFNIVSGTLNLDVIDGGPAAGLIKTGGGTLGLNSASTYQGHTTVNDGDIRLSHPQALGAFGSDASGTTINGPGSIVLHNNSVVTGEKLFLNDEAELAATGTGGWNAPIRLTGAPTINVFNGALCTMSGVVSGTGGLEKTGLGTLRLEGPSANSFSGGTVVRQGTLQLAKFSGVSAIPGELTVGDGLGAADADRVVLLSHDQIADDAPITIADSGLLDVNGWNESLGPITFDGGHLDSGGLGLQLLGDVMTEPRNDVIALIDGQVRLSGVGMTFQVANGNVIPDLKIAAKILGSVDRPLIKTGAGTIHLLSPANAYDGQTQVREGTLGLQLGGQPGSALSGTVVSNGATFFLGNNTQVDHEELSLHGSGSSGTLAALWSYAGTNLWGGAIHLSAQSAILVSPTNSLLILSGKLDGPAAFTKLGPGTLRLSGDTQNNYVGIARAQEGVLELNKLAANGAIRAGGLVIGTSNGVAQSVVVRALRDDQFAFHVPVEVRASGLLDLNYHPQAFGSLAGAGQVHLVFSRITLTHEADTTFSGVIGGVSTNISLLKQSGGRCFLTGANTYAGKTVVNDGNLFINGQQPNSALLVQSSGVLNGSGRAGDILVMGGVVSPGNDGVFGPGLARLSCGNVSWSASSGFWVDLAGPQAGTNYCQLNVAGTVNLGEATLRAKLMFFSAVGNQFIILKNDGADPIVGTFKGLPEGATLESQGAQFQISYVGGTGNDVVLTQLTFPPPPQVGALALLPEGQIEIGGVGIPGLLYTIEANSDLKNSNWIGIGTAIAVEPNGAIHFIDPTLQNLSQRFYRFVLP